VIIIFFNYGKPFLNPLIYVPLAALKQQAESDCTEARVQSGPFSFTLINIQHAPLHGNTTCFRLSTHNMVTYIYNLCKLLLFSIDTVSLRLVFLCIACYF